MPAEAPQRPGQATLAGWLIIGGSIVLVLSAWQRIASLNTLEVQEEFARVLSEPPVDGSGLTINALSTIVRVLCLVAAGAATAATILGIQALRRSTGARIALTCLAPLVLVGGVATAGFFAPMVVAGITMLWLQPTRDWFAGRPWAQRLTRSGQPDRSDQSSRPNPFAVPETEDPRPDAGTTPSPAALPPGTVIGGRPEQPAAAPNAPVTPNPYLPAGSATRAADRRPSALIWACTLTWVSTALVAGGLLLVTLAVAVGGDELWTEFERQQGPLEDLGITRGEVATGVYALTALAVPWCIAAAVLAGFALAGRRWARIALAVSSALAGLVMLVMALASPPLVVLVAVCAVTTWLLLRADVAAWRR